jgi:exonuclease SbcD
MKIVVTADNHLNRYYKKMRPEQLEKRREKLRENFSKVVEHAVEIDADLFLHCGDLFDMSNPRNQEVAFVASKLAQLDAKGIQSFLVVGNHDKSMSSAENSSPQSVYRSFEGPNTFLSTEGRSESVEINGETVEISGLSYDPMNDGDPLEEFEAGEADWSILLTHYGIEGTLIEEKSTISRETIRESDLDLICSGHIHRHAEMNLGGTTAVIPGITERLDFNEAEYSTGFYVIEIEEEITTRYKELGSQPMQKVEVDAQEPVELMEKVEELSGEEKMLQMKLVGELSREEYRELELHELWEKGRKENFYFGLKDEISLKVGADVLSEGERLSQEEKLKETAEKIREESSDEKIVEKASERVLTDYREN